jgi:hypothetical protein
LKPLYIWTAAPDKAQAVATSLADLNAMIAALADPVDATNAATIARISATLPQLGLNDDEPLELHFYSAVGTEESWPADAANSVSVSLGLLRTDGTLATTTADTIASTYRTGTLTLTTSALKGYLQGWAKRGFATLWLHIRRTDSGGLRTTQVLMPVQVSESVLNSGITSPDANQSYLTAAEIAAAYEAKSSAYKLVPLLFAGNATDEQAFGYFYAEVATRVVGMVITAQTAPVGSAITVDLVTVGGVEQSKVATLAAAATYQRTAYATALELAAGAEIRGKIKSVGSGTPGGWLMCYLITRPNY